MTVTEITLTDFFILQDFFTEAYLPAPFATSLSAAIKKTTEMLFSTEYFLYGVFEKRRFVAVAAFKKEDQQLTCQALFLSKKRLLSLEKIKAFFTEVGLKEFAKKIIFHQKVLPFFQQTTPEIVMPQVKTALVLGGGGAKGAYEIGSYRYFKEKQFPIDMITGTSVGSLNGGLILQGNLEKAANLWETLVTSQVIDFNNEKEDTFSYTRAFAKKAFKDVGISTAPLKKLIETYMDPEKIQTSPIDFYLVTTLVPQLKEVVVALKEVPKEEFADWLIASSSFFPGMALKEINGNFYMDGGYKNNLPEDIAYEKGARRFLTIDVKGPGIIKRNTFPEKTTKQIFQSPWNLGEVLYFDGNQAKNNLQLGFLEAQKVFHEACGYWYTFDKEMLKQQYFLGLEFLKRRRQPVDKKDLFELAGLYGKVVHEYNFPQVCLELLGQYYEISPYEKYSFSYFINEIQQHYQESKEMPLDPLFSLEGKRGPLTPLLLLQKQRFTMILKGENIGNIGVRGLKFLKEFLEFIGSLTSERTEHGD